MLESMRQEKIKYHEPPRSVAPPHVSDTVGRGHDLRSGLENTVAVKDEEIKSMEQRKKDIVQRSRWVRGQWSKYLVFFPLPHSPHQSDNFFSLSSATRLASEQSEKLMIFLLQYYFWRKSPKRTRSK